jgi:hypothetical protein
MAKRTHKAKQKQLDKYDVFVSYAHQDLARVLPLVKALRERELNVWFDEREIRAHEGITDRVRNGLARSKLLLAYYSRTYPTRRACQWELTAAFLAAQALGEDPRARVLVVNPEREADGGLLTEHIQPVQLRDASCCIEALHGDAPEWDAEAVRVAELASSHGRQLGEARGKMPGQPGRRLVDTPGFVGRLDELWEIHSALTAGDAALISASTGGEVAQIAGLAGIGKSLLAEEYALRFAAAYPGGVMWLRASVTGEGEGALERAATRAGVETRLTEAQRDGLLGGERDQARHAQIRAVAVDLGISVSARSPDEVRADVAAAIAQAGPSLWVVDDLREGLDSAEVRAWLAPHPNAKTLITTRSRGYELGRRVDIDGLGDDDGYLLLTAKRKPAADDRVEDVAARGLVADLGGHALALTVAGHRLAAETGMRSFAEYRAALAERAEDALELAAELRPQLPNGHESSIAATLLDSIERLGEPGRDLLRVMSMLAPAPFSKRMLSDVFAEADALASREARDRAVRAIADTSVHSLSEPANPDGNSFSVHALVARAIAFEEADSERVRELRIAAPEVLLRHVRSLSEKLSESQVRAHMRGEAWADFIAHARELSYNAFREAETGVSGAVVPLLDLAAHHDFERREYQAAAASWELCLTLLEFIEEGQSAPALRVKDYLADVLATLGDLPRARELAQDVVEARERQLPPDDEETLTALQTYAKTLDRQQGREVLQRVAKARARKSGEDDPGTLDAREDRAALLIAQDPQAARDELERILEVREASAESNDLRTIQTRQNLAVALLTAGEAARAREHFEWVLEQRRGRRGVTHEETVNTMFYVAQLRAGEDPEGAREMLEHVRDWRTDRYGPEHERTVHAVEALDRLSQRPADLTVMPADGDTTGLVRTVVDGVTVDHPPGMSLPTLGAAAQPLGAGSRSAATPHTGKKPARNAPCVCGSPKKYKHCCGA